MQVPLKAFLFSQERSSAQALEQPLLGDCAAQFKGNIATCYSKGPCTRWGMGRTKQVTKTVMDRAEWRLGGRSSVKQGLGVMRTSGLAVWFEQNIGVPTG